MKRVLFLLLMFVCIQGVQAQTEHVSGTVLDQANLPVIGANIRVDGTKLGAATDIDGKFEISGVPTGASITVSYIGMKTVTMKAGRNLVILLEDDSQMLDEVITIGYGSAKAKDLTSPIVVVRGEELSNIPSSNPMQALQGKVAGVNIINSGTPGSGPMVRIRGNGSFENSSPLYVVDGMFYDNIDFLNSNDIQDMSVLKDASAAAIYGVRAANGVVLITTKKGVRNTSAKITYDGYVGMQKATNVLKMANSAQYAQMLMEANFNAYNSIFKNSIDRFGGDYSAADFHDWTFASNTDWYKELLRDAMITNHAVGINGGSQNGTYSLGVNYLHQDGIMNIPNNYKRLNFRAALEYDANSWLKVGFNGVYSKSEQIQPNAMAWQAAFNAPGIFPVYDDKNKEAFPQKFANPADIGFTSNFFNPIALAHYHDSKNNISQFLTNFYAQFNILPDMLNFKTAINYDNSTIEGRTFTAPYYVSSWQQLKSSLLNKSTTTYENYIWDNTFSFNNRWKSHAFGAMLGASMRQEKYRFLSGTADNVPVGKEEYYYISQGNEEGRKSSDGGNTYRGLSYFARLNYNYLNKYYLMFTFRADGSSKYQERWGYFPSIGASWVLSEEDFMKNQSAIDYLKLRASWGKLGNDHVAASDGFASIYTGNGASGVFGNATYPGYQNTTYFSYLKWELVDEFNIGFNLSTLKNRLNIDFDYYNRITKNAVISPRLPFSNQTLAGNYGKISNSGFDVSIAWNDRIGKEFKYHFVSNLSFLKNKIKDLSGTPIIHNGFTYNIVGQEMNSYYGYKVIGIYQTPEEIANDPIAVENGLEPGDFKYEDVNKNGKIDGDDRQVLGAYIPNFTYSFDLGFEWKNFDFSLRTYGQAGAEFYNRKRALRYAQSNYNFDEAQYKNRWTAAGSTNTDPSAKALTKGWNVSDQRVNSYFVERADFFRIQNITLGYTFKKINLGNYILPSMRISLSADRPATFFSANTFTPEISHAHGWDTNVYPLTATYTLGVQVQF